MMGYEKSYPDICVEVGLTCIECTSNTAREVARVCKGLRGKMVGQMFVQLYPHPACSPMHGQFAQAYRDASPREPQSETSLRAIRAVA
ncbi:MAG: hypothetical protein JWO19_4124 [Bryobacterales bacterium]|nr:hypothetical protein [Bryobacterales bacterium]